MHPGAHLSSAFFDTLKKLYSLFRFMSITPLHVTVESRQGNNLNPTEKKKNFSPTVTVTP